MALTAAQLPIHEYEYTVVESEWGERNHLHEQYKKELNPALRSCIATGTVLLGGRALELRQQVQTSGPVAVRRPESNFQHSCTRQGKI